MSGERGSSSGVSGDCDVLSWLPRLFSRKSSLGAESWSCLHVMSSVGRDMILYMYPIIGRGSFCFNYCLNSAWHGGDQFVALLRWYGSPGVFDSGLQLICIFLVSCFSFSS